MHRTYAALSLVGVALCAACAGPGRPSTMGEGEATRLVGRRTAGGEIEVDAYDASQLFERAYARLDAHECEDAVVLYDQIVREFPTSRFVSPSLYNAGLCLQQARQFARAVEHYEALLERVPGSEDANSARFQMISALLELEDWTRATEIAEALLRDGALRSDERLEAMAQRARALFGAGRIEDAERTARDATSYFRTRQGAEVISDDTFAAAAQFVIGECLRARSEAMSLPDGDVVTQRTILDRRSALLLDAQRAYFDTIRYANPHWSAAAGYRIGALFQGLFDALTNAPVPPPTRPMGPEALEIYRRSYRAQLRDRVRPLVRAAVRYWELTLMMVERQGVSPEDAAWVERTRGDLEAARARLVDAEVAPPPADPPASGSASPTSPPPTGSPSPAPEGAPPAPSAP